MADLQTFYDIILIIPRYRPKDGFIWKAIEYRFHSPGVLSIASYLNSKGFKCVVFDCNLEQISDEDFEKEFDIRFSRINFGFIGFSAATQTINSAYNFAGILKKKYPACPIIFGGPHPTALPDDVLKYSFTDIVVMGEGELTTEKILQRLPLCEINGIAFKENNKTIINRPADRIKNLDELPIPDYYLVPIHLSKPLIGTYRELPATILVSARGCPGRCTFCSRVLGPELFLNSPERILEEIKILHYNHGFKQFIFYDDTFISFPKRVEEFCDLLIESGIKIYWTCSSRVDRVYPELLIKMKNAGCHQIMYGIESFDVRILQNINKRTKPEDIFFAIKETQKAGIEARAAIMIGNTGDTTDILNDNIKKLIKLNPDVIQVTITTAIPGSKMFNEAIKNNQILTFDWNKYEGSDQITKHENLDFKTMQKYYRKTYARFYFRPAFIIKTLFKINSWMKIKFIIVGILSIIPIISSSVFKRNRNEAKA